MRKGQKLSVAIVHPRLGRGGSEARVMWAAEALKLQFAVSIITTGRVDLEQLNRFYGTNLTDSEIVVRSLPIPRLLRNVDCMAALRGALFQRALRRIVCEYSILISAYNLCDFGMPGIHCIADFSWDEEVRSTLHPAPTGARGTIHRFKFLRRLYLGMTTRIAARSEHDMFAGDDLIIANSEWTARIFRERYGVASTVLYPPVMLGGGSVPFVDRKAEFVCIGRISSEKRIERIIDIVSEVRHRGHCVGLRIVGAFDGSVYARKIEALARRYSEWVTLEGPRLGTSKVASLTSCRYGIHACEGEALGIGVAELIKAGCITFAPAEGGQAEILNHPALLYRDEDDAAEKITAVLDREALREELIRHLRCQAEKFSAENFMSGLRSVVDGFLIQSGSRAEISSGRRNAGLS